MDSYKILIIDDMIENLKTMVSIFSEHLPKYKIFQTNNPENALSIAKQTSPDLVVTDWDMPKVSGIELTNSLKEDSETKDIPVIMVTGVMLTTEHLKTALEAGAVDYVRKPIEPVELIARTKSALMLSEYFKQNLQQKDQELTESSLFMVKNSEYIHYFAGRLNKLGDYVDIRPREVKEELEELRKDILRHIDEQSWYRFNLSFSKVHKDFNSNILMEHPGLTPTDIKMCSFIKLGMANKEIALVLNQTPDSVKVSRYRLRKKLNLENGVNLESYIGKF